MSDATNHVKLLDDATNGDNSALSALVKLYHDRVYQFGLRVCRDSFDTTDAVQEAFIKLSTRPDVMNSSNRLAWLRTVVRNACFRLLRPFRREKRRLGDRVDGLEQVQDDQLSPAQVLERWRLVETVHACIAALDLPFRQVIILRDIEGLSGEEASNALNIDLAALKSRLHRARAALRAQLISRGFTTSSSTQTNQAERN
jgi:RNA polymerase sigma-70 factor, ECF subfamily